MVQSLVWPTPTLQSCCLDLLRLVVGHSSGMVTGNSWDCLFRTISAFKIEQHTQNHLFAGVGAVWSIDHTTPDLFCWCEPRCQCKLSLRIATEYKSVDNHAAKVIIQTLPVSCRGSTKSGRYWPINLRDVMDCGRECFDKWTRSARVHFLLLQGKVLDIFLAIWCILWEGGRGTRWIFSVEGTHDKNTC